MHSFDYLNPALPAGLARVAMPVVDARDAVLAGYGRLVDAPDACAVEIVRWPAQGWRPVDDDSGDEGGTTEGIFACQWVGDVLKAQNHAVGGDSGGEVAGHPVRGHEGGHGDRQDGDVRLEPGPRGEVGQHPAEGRLGELPGDEQNARPRGGHGDGTGDDSGEAGGATSPFGEAGGTVAGAGVAAGGSGVPMANCGSLNTV